MIKFNKRNKQFHILQLCHSHMIPHSFFISNTFISKARQKLAKNQTNAKQHPEVGLLLFETDSYLSSKNNMTYF